MKQFISIFCLVVCGLFVFQTTVLADRIPTKGKWGIEDARSLVPAAPTASLEGNTLSIDFINPLTDLTIQIKDNTGAVVHEEIISVSTPQSYIIPLNIPAGEYTLNMTHWYGCLTGKFILEK